MRPHAHCPHIWLGIQPTEDTCEGPSHQFLWLSLWCQWSPLRPRQGWCCTCLASTHQCHWTSRVLRSSHIPKSLHPWSVHLDWPSTRAAQEGCRLQMELHLWHHFWVHTYIYGWAFMIESDHKPLESISRQNLVDTPAWLQCMMLCLQGYDFTIHYCPGKEMVIPDTLSHFSPCPGPDLPLDIAIYHACIMPDCKEAFQQAFINNPEMRALANLIITGWPEDIKEVPNPLHPYWQQRETSPLRMV